VLYDEGQTFVFRVIDGRLRKTEVVTGYRQDDLQVISRGLAAHEQVVVQGVAALTDGQQVQVSEVHPMSGKVMSGKAAAEINIPGQDKKEN
jgi:ribosomal protein S17